MSVASRARNPKQRNPQTYRGGTFRCFVPREDWKGIVEFPVSRKKYVMEKTGWRRVGKLSRAARRVRREERLAVVMSRRAGASPAGA